MLFWKQHIHKQQKHTTQSSTRNSICIRLCTTFLHSFKRYSRVVIRVLVPGPFPFIKHFFRIFAHLVMNFSCLIYTHRNPNFFFSFQFKMHLLRKSSQCNAIFAYELFYRVEKYSRTTACVWRIFFYCVQSIHVWALSNLKKIWGK